MMAAPVAMAAAAAANTVLFFLAKASNALYRVNWQGGSAPATEMPVLPVIVSSAVPALLGAIVLALLAKFAAARALLIFEIVAAVLVLASLADPLLLPPSTSMVSKVVLCAMHVLAGAATVGVLGTMGVKRSG
jgi:hypothetical protein